MEGLNRPTNEEIREEDIQSPEQPETRAEKMMQAEKSVREKFEARMAQVLDNLAENPYFRDLSERTF